MYKMKSSIKEKTLIRFLWTVDLNFVVIAIAEFPVENRGNNEKRSSILPRLYL
jgi:hypothetical protein